MNVPATRWRAFGSWAYCAGLALSPVTARIPGVPLSLPDLCLSIAIMLSIPSVWRQVSAPWEWGRTQWLPIPFGVAVVLSALASPSIRASAPETVQVLLYVYAAAWAVPAMAKETRGREALVVAAGMALALGGAGAVWGRTVSPEQFEFLFGARYGLLASLLMLSAALIVVSRRRAALTVAIVVLLLATSLLFTFPSRQSKAVVGSSDVPQRYIEAYAALGVLADRPLWGVGPGNYQAAIGPYYQGLPKANTMEHGSQVGAAVLLATLGISGFATAAWWFMGLWGAAGAWRMRGALTMVLVAACLSPMLIAPVFLPLALLHAVMAGQREDAYAS